MTSQELIQIRGQLGLTPNEMARALKVRPETVWRWEHGYHISLKAAAKILRLMGTETCPTCGQIMVHTRE